MIFIKKNHGLIVPKRSSVNRIIYKLLIWINY
ncbi:hypothetical protein [Pedobacter sp. HDW13]